MVQTALLATASVLVALALFELGLRIETEPTDFLDRTSDAFWIARLHGSAADPFAPPSLLEHDAKLGWRPRRGYSAPGVTHGADGLRAVPGQSERGEAPAIVVLGDSFVYGLGVQDEETFPAALARLLPEYRVYNFGVGGFGVDQAYLLWLEHGAALRPRFVVLGYFVDDFLRDLNHVREGAKPRFVVAGDRLEATGVPAPTPAALRAGIAAKEDRGGLRLGILVQAALRRASRLLRDEDLPEGFAEGETLSHHLLAALQRSIRAAGAELVVVVIPHCAHDGFEGADAIAGSVVASCRALDIPAFDLHPAFQSRDARGDQPALYGSNCHWSPEGAYQAAATVAPHLRRLDEGRAPGR